MTIESYIIFSLDDHLYGIETKVVKEIFYIPELISLPETPRDLVGFLNLRSENIPVMHLALRLGLSFEGCSLDDSVIVLHWQELNIGVIVNEVKEVQKIYSQEIEEELDYGRINNIKTPFVKGLVQIQDKTIIILNHQNLIRYQDELVLAIDAIDDCNLDDSIANSNCNYQEFYDFCFTGADLKTKNILKNRAKELRNSLQNKTKDKFISFAVVSLNNEYFGFDLSQVKEFGDIYDVTPIPGSPKHIVGNMNLRGEIITLIEIRQLLNLPNKLNASPKKMVLIKGTEIVVGIAIDEVVDIINLKNSEIMSSINVNNQVTKRYIQGTINYGKTLLTIIDLEYLIQQPELLVN